MTNFQEAPNRVLLAGDWHGNANWATTVIHRLPEIMPHEDRPLILHAGDFGVWPGYHGERYLAAVEEALEAVNGELWFVDGNHEWFPELYRWRALLRDEERGGPIPMPGSDRIAWLPRGMRWEWWGKTWLALGGAVSVDRALRTKGRDWWPEEYITAEDVQRCLDGGAADVMLCHDAPDIVQMNFDTPPRFWAAEDLARAETHRKLISQVVDAVRPELLIHGHYHRPVCQEHGNLRVIGLDMDGETGNIMVLDLWTLTERKP